MENKTVILSVLLIIVLIMAQTQVDAGSCCPSSTGRNIYNACRFGGGPRSMCARLSGCQIVQGACPGGYSNQDILKNSADAINEYCNLGCVSSACGALTTLQNSDPSAIVNRAVEQCSKACSTFCTKGSVTAVEAA